MKVVAIVQARLGSTRLPNKVMMDIHGSPMIKWVLQRTKAAQTVDEVVVATTLNHQDEILATWCVKNGYQIYCGSEVDVLDRYYHCAKEFFGDLIVRITADDPLKEPSIIDEAVTKLTNTRADYCSNTITPSYPEGLDIEVFTFGTLERAFREAKLPSEREHVTPYIWKNKHLFNLAELIFERDLSAWRWTVDTLDDLIFIRNLLSMAGGKINVNYKQLIAEIDKNHELKNQCLAKTVRNEGYLKSINNERTRQS